MNLIPFVCFFLTDSMFMQEYLISQVSRAIPPSVPSEQTKNANFCSLLEGIFKGKQYKTEMAAV